ncbi:hypothetical protein CANARDRAFT_29948 [[Candida] arabinofermentans NRRL YB-2248]|uniref:Phosphoglycerate mutase-like protein n=1 Tax=[Candida] arabinofermentans NRRL YB-2248 TaxID=983967 RepID=A0A1E4SVG9_9ASCO|nr:hypothetical protein CANARDRAFT_29948 [[Candida] arabinofermentans NRRL YB-2248]
MARPRLILLVRHGESQGNKDKSVNRYIPNHKVPLTEKGHQQALDAGDVLRSYLKETDSICFYTSPYLRAKQTLDGIIDSISDMNIDYKVYEEPRMREQDFGNFQGTAEEMEQIWIERAQYGHFFYRIPHGESAADVYDRCASFNETLFRQFSKESFPTVLVLVTHGIWARVFLTKWFRWTVGHFEDLQNVPNCEWMVMEKSEDTHRYQLLTHLSTWSELEEIKRNAKLKKDTCEEFRFNTHVPVTEDEVNQVIDAEVKAKAEQIEKSVKIKQMYDKMNQDKKRHMELNRCHTDDADDDHDDDTCKNMV